MMEIISIVALFINAVAAAPPLPPGVSRNTVINWDRPFHGGILGGVYYCDDIKWGKTCLYGAYELAKCHDVPNNWNDIISSFGPDKGTYCFVYEDVNCMGDSRLMQYPGSENLLRQGFNDRISSFSCGGYQEQ